jgi:hypothetical protein
MHKPATRPYNRSFEVRWLIRVSEESNVALARRYGLNPKTIAKWKKRTWVHDLKRGPRRGAMSSLAAADEYLACSLRAYARLPLSCCLSILQRAFPNLTRSSLYRCFQRKGLARLPTLSSQARGRPPRFDRKYDRVFFGDLINVNVDTLWVDFLLLVDVDSGVIFGKVVHKSNPEEAVKTADILFPTLPGRRKWLFINERGGLVELQARHPTTLDPITHIRTRHACAVTKIPTFLPNESLRITEPVADLLFGADRPQRPQDLIERIEKIIEDFNQSGAMRGLPAARGHLPSAPPDTTRDLVRARATPSEPTTLPTS